MGPPSLRRVSQVPLHPALESVLAVLQPVSVERAEWTVGPLEFALYLDTPELPDELVTSVRCIVQVGTAQLLLCEDAHPSVNIWPGGRRDRGESWTETAVREVAEETGWQLDPATLVMLGFLHFRHLTPVPVDHPYPHPDFLQVVLHGRATGDAAGWVDSEGYVLRTTAVDVGAVESLPVTDAERHAVRALSGRP